MKDKEAQFFQLATTLPFPEIRDDRDEFSIPEIRQLSEIISGGDMAEAHAYANGLMRMFPDFDLIPFSVAYGYLSYRYAKEALDVALEVLPRVKRHYRLYSVVGQAEAARNRLAEGIVWWSRSIIAQCTVLEFLEEDPFVYLGYVSTIIGEQLDADVFFSLADHISGGPRRLDPNQVDILLPLRDHWSRKVVKQLIRHLQVEYNLA